MRMALRIWQSGTAELLDLGTTGEESYKAISEGVGGYIEPVRLSDNLTMWVNEEGKLADKWYVNHFAQRIFAATFGNVDLMHGDVVITGGVDENGDDVGLTREQIIELAELGAR